MTAANAAMPPVKAPWTVGRAPLFEDAAEDFLGEVTRQQPWHHARYEALAERLGLFLHPDGLAPLSALTDERAAQWLETQGLETQGLETLGLEAAQDRELGRRFLTDLREYLREFGWLGQ